MPRPRTIVNAPAEAATGVLALCVLMCDSILLTSNVTEATALAEGQVLATVG